MNRREFMVPTAVGALTTAFVATRLDFGLQPVMAQDGQETLGGQPPKDQPAL